MKPINPKKRTRTNLKGEKVTIEKNNGIFDKVKIRTKKDGSQIIKTKAVRENMYGPAGSKALVKNKIVRSPRNESTYLRLEPVQKEKIKQLGGLNRITGFKRKRDVVSSIERGTGDLVEIHKYKVKKNAFSKPKKETIEVRKDPYSHDILGERRIKSNRKTK